MFSFKLGSTTVNFWPAILILLVVILARDLWFAKQTKQMVKLCQTAQYDKSIVIANKMLSYYQNVYKRLKRQKTKSAIDTLNLYLAISYLGLSNTALFMQHIETVDDSRVEKHFWLALFHMLANDFEKFQVQYDIVVSKQPSKYLNAIILYKEGKTAEAHDILNDLYPTLKFCLLEDIAKKIIKE